MYKIILRKQAKDTIEKFIISYKNSYLKMYSDTWIYYEDIIRENYIKIAKNFYFDIKNNIEKSLQEEKIIAYKPLENNKFIITIKVLNYRLFVEYSENNNDKLRFVENISFNKK